MRGAVLFLPLFFLGCDEDAPSDTASEGDTDPTEDGWALGSHPCDSRTDDLWFDDADEGYLGCGQATTGHGLWRTLDGGITWETLATGALGSLSAFRVNDIHRDPTSGTLYLAGTSEGPGVVALEDDALIDVWTPGKTVDDAFTAGSFRVTSTGFAVVESLTGTGLMTRPDADTAPDGWTAVGTSWSTDDQSHQILDLDQHDDAFYAVGSTISEPLLVFLPSGAPRFELTPRALHASARGELWAIDVDHGGIVAGGVDQLASTGHVFTFSFPGDPLVDDWRDFDLSTLWPDDATWVRGVCRNGQRVVAVGAFSKRKAGFVLESTDGGASFHDVTPGEPVDVPPLWDCWVHADGKLVVTGEGGFSAVRR